MKAERDNPTATIGNFNTPLSIMKKTTSQNGNKKIENIIIMYLTGVYGTLHPPAAIIHSSQGRMEYASRQRP